MSKSTFVHLAVLHLFLRSFSGQPHEKYKRTPAHLATIQHEWDTHLCTFELKGQAQMLFLSAATQYALTTVLAGFAFTIIPFPNTSFLPALVAGFLRVLSMQRPGMVNLPVPLTSLVATSASVSSTFLHTAGFNSVAVASAAAMPDLDIAAPAFAFIARGAIARLG